MTDVIEIELISEGSIESEVDFAGEFISGASMEPNLQEKTAIPTVEQQIITYDPGYDGLRSVEVEGVTANIDENIKPENIVDGVDILGVEGTAQSFSFTVDCRFCVDELIIPEHVTSIAMYAFYYSPIRNIILHSGLTSIGNYGFRGSEIIRAIIPESVTDIGGMAFADCKKLLEVYLPASVTRLTNTSFQGCNAIESFTIGKGFSQSLYIQWATNLPAEVLENIIDNLADLSGQEKQLLKIGSANIKKISEAYILKLETKNWDYE